MLQLIAKAPGKPGAAVVLAGEAVLDAWPGGVTQACKQAVTEALLATMLDDRTCRADGAGAGPGRCWARWAIRVTWMR